MASKADQPQGWETRVRLIQSYREMEGEVKRKEDNSQEESERGEKGRKARRQQRGMGK